MAFPADYFIPMKSVIDDVPISGDLGYYKVARAQLEGMRLMINERIAQVPGNTPIPTLADPLPIAATLKDFHFTVQLLKASFVDTDRFPAADIAGVNMSTTGTQVESVNWQTMTALMSSISGGVGGQWTEIPARNNLGRSASGYNPIFQSLFSKPIFTEHVNELYRACQKLRYRCLPMQYRLPDGTVGNIGKFGTFQTSTAAAARTQALVLWGLSSGFQHGVFTSQSKFGASDYMASVVSSQFKLLADLTPWSTGTTKIYVGVQPFTTSDYSPPYTANSLWNLESTQSNGGTYLTATYGTLTPAPSFAGDPTGLFEGRGWITWGAMVVDPVYTYT